LPTPKFTRRAPLPGGRTEKGLVTVAGIELTPEQSTWLTNYLVRFNGSEASRAAGQSYSACGVHSARMLTNANVRAALRNALIEKQRRVNHDADEVTRYWWAIATADARELSGVIYVPCRHCHGVDHDYQFTDVEQRQREREYARQVSEHQAAVERLRQDHPNAALPEAPLFFEGGGGGYTTNRYPMRGSDWAEKVERYFAQIERPVPEGLVPNADHSCPACHGDGVRTVWFADTRHLNSSAAIAYNGVKQTKDGIEYKMRDRDAAMDKFAQLTGMIGPLRVAVTPDMAQLSSDTLALELSRRGVVVDGEFEVVSGGSSKVIEDQRPLGLPRPDLLRPRTS
jgi:phage terminase small subunit